MTQPPIIHPVILCGGSGSRLWPESQPAKPKPFLPLLGADTLFQQTIARFADDVRFAEPIIVAGAHHEALVAAQMGDAPYRLIVEPAPRGTASAIALAASILPPDAIMLVAPSDHAIAHAGAMRNAAEDAACLAREGKLVALGVTPERGETGYGYIRLGAKLDPGFSIAEFVEKPSRDRAEAFAASGDYVWNAGIFVFRADAILRELVVHRPRMGALLHSAVDEGRWDGFRFIPGPSFADIAAESIDNAVMEHSEAGAAIRVDMGWSDIGTWRALQDALAEQADEEGNVVQGEVALDGCRGVLARTDSLRVTAIGMEDVCVVVANGEVLILRRDLAQRVGDLPDAADEGPMR
ncbi:MAG: sugar phosphate nucleotidyltransferase [Erythrobacter sp.]